MSKRRTRHLRVMRSGNSQLNIVVNLRTRTYTWYGRHLHAIDVVPTTPMCSVVQDFVDNPIRNNMITVSL